MIARYNGPILNEKHEFVEVADEKHEWWHMTCDFCGAPLETDEIGCVTCPEKADLEDIAYDEEWIDIATVHVCPRCQDRIRNGEVELKFTDKDRP